MFAEVYIMASTATAWLVAFIILLSYVVEDCLSETTKRVYARNVVSVQDLISSTPSPISCAVVRNTLALQRQLFLLPSQQQSEDPVQQPASIPSPLSRQLNSEGYDPECQKDEILFRAVQCNYWFCFCVEPTTGLRVNRDHKVAKKDRNSLRCSTDSSLQSLQSTTSMSQPMTSVPLQSKSPEAFLDSRFFSSPYVFAAFILVVGGALALILVGVLYCIQCGISGSREGPQRGRHSAVELLSPSTRYSFPSHLDGVDGANYEECNRTLGSQIYSRECNNQPLAASSSSYSYFSTANNRLSYHPYHNSGLWRLTQPPCPYKKEEEFYA